MQQNYAIINFFESENKEYWLEKIKESVQNGSIEEKLKNNLWVNKIIFLLEGLF